MHCRIGFVGDPKQRERRVEGDLHPPAPGDDCPDSLENRILHPQHRSIKRKAILANLPIDLRIGKHRPKKRRVPPLPGSTHLRCSPEDGLILQENHQNIRSDQHPNGSGNQFFRDCEGEIRVRSSQRNHRLVIRRLIGRHCCLQ